MSNRTRRKHLFNQRMRAAVHAGTLPDDLSALGNGDFYRAIRIAFYSIRRPPLRLPNLESKDNLNSIQAKNERRADEFDLLDDDLELLHDDLRDSIGWEDYQGAIDKATRAFNGARDLLEPLRRVARWKFDQPRGTSPEGGYFIETEDYIAPIRQKAHDVWHMAYSITKHIRRADDPANMAHWWLRRTWSACRIPAYFTWEMFRQPPEPVNERVPAYATLAIVAMHQAYSASTEFQNIVRHLDEEAVLARIAPHDDKAVRMLRERHAAYERGQSRYAHSLLDEAKDYLTAARLAVSGLLGEEEMERQLQSALPEAIRGVFREMGGKPKAELVPSFLRAIWMEDKSVTGDKLFDAAVDRIEKEGGRSIAWESGSVWVNYDDDIKLQGRKGPPGDMQAEIDGKPLGVSAVRARLTQFNREEKAPKPK